LLAGSSSGRTLSPIIAPDEEESLGLAELTINESTNGTNDTNEKRERARCSRSLACGKIGPALGSGQVARQRPLEPKIAGSNPASPAWANDNRSPCGERFFVLADDPYARVAYDLNAHPLPAGGEGMSVAD